MWLWNTYTMMNMAECDLYAVCIINQHLVFHYDPIWCGTVWVSLLWHTVTQYAVVHCDQYAVVRCAVVHCDLVCCSALWQVYFCTHTKTRYTVVRCEPMCCCILWPSMLWWTDTMCSGTLWPDTVWSIANQYAVVHCDHQIIGQFDS